MANTRGWETRQGREVGAVTRKIALEVQGVTKNFGGLKALNDITMEVPEGVIVGLIGPNGAGKTTLFNAITGVYPVSAGRINLFGQDITRLRPHNIVRLGIARTFQTGRPFHNMTVLENVLVGCYFGGKRRISNAEAVSRSMEILEFVELAHRQADPVTSLNLLDRRIVEMARALATGPRLLLLDEVLAGLNPADLGRAVEIIKRLRDRLGITVLWIEHIMKAIMGTADYIIVLHYGQKLAEGRPEEVVDNAEVNETYFGERGVKLA